MCHKRKSARSLICLKLTLAGYQNKALHAEHFDSVSHVTVLTDCRESSKQVDEKKQRDPNDPNNHLVFNYSYYDSGRRDHLHAPAQTQKKLGSE